MQTWEANVRRVVPYTPGEQPDHQDMIKLNTNETVSYTHLTLPTIRLV